MQGPTGKKVVGAKIVSVRPSNAALSPPLPTVPATILLLDDATGTLTTLINSTLLTAIRTAAGSALATQRLRSGKSTSSLAVFGAGMQGVQHARHILHSFPSVTSVKIMNRSEPRALAARASLAAEFGGRVACISFEVVLLSDRPGVQAAVEGADVICLCTNSSEPLFDAGWLKEGAHINGVGSFTPYMQEVDAGTVGRCDKVVLDSFEALPVGDIAKALEAGAVKKEELVEVRRGDAAAAANSVAVLTSHTTNKLLVTAIGAARGGAGEGARGLHVLQVRRAGLPGHRSGGIPIGSAGGE